jgi:Fe-S cluster assembly protein SufD
MPNSLTARILADHLLQAPPAALHGQLASALQQGLPGARSENWKYANLRVLESARFRARTELDAGAVELARQCLPPRVAGFARIVFVDGLHCGELSDSAPSFARIARGPGAAADAATPAAPGANAQLRAELDLRFGLVNQAFAIDRLLVDLPEGAEAALEVLLIAVADAGEAASHPALDILVRSDARLQLLERVLSPASSSPFCNARISIELQPRARMEHWRLQQHARGARHLESLDIVLGAAAQYSVLGASSGALAARCTALVTLAGDAARLGWRSVTVADGNQVNDAYVRVEHRGRAGTTEQAFRGIAAGRARVGFNGSMIVRETARGSSTAQSLKTLLAGPQAEIDVRPQLQIHTDDVRASHGATAGKLDEAMRFYLLSRGIDPRDADALLKWAFVAEVIAAVPLPALRAQLEQTLGAALQQVATRGDGP